MGIIAECNDAHCMLQERSCIVSLTAKEREKSKGKNNYKFERKNMPEGKREMTIQYGEGSYPITESENLRHERLLKK